MYLLNVIIDSVLIYTSPLVFTSSAAHRKLEKRDQKAEIICRIDLVEVTI